MGLAVLLLTLIGLMFLATWWLDFRLRQVERAMERWIQREKERSCLP